MRPVPPLSPMASVDCAYFLSPRGCTYPHGPPPYVFRIPLVCGRPNLPPARRGGPFVFIFLRIAFPATSFFSQPSRLPGGRGGSRSLSNSVGDVRLHALEEKQSPDQHHSHPYGRRRHRPSRRPPPPCQRPPKTNKAPRHTGQPTQPP